MSAHSPQWSEPGTYEVAPGVYRIPLPMPNDGLRAVNVYAIEDADGVVLIDTGWNVAEAREQLASGLSDIGYELADVRRFLITHIHHDHYTLGVALRAEYGTPIALGQGERHSLELMLRHEYDDRFGEPLRWGVAEWMERFGSGYDPDEVRQVYDWPDEWLSGTTDIELNKRVLHAVPTPGHTRGHVVYRDPEAGLLFSGDHVLPHITPSIGFERAMARSPLSDYLDSLALLRDYPDMRLLPAHGPVGDSVHQRVGELLEHHERRLAATENAVREGARTVYECAGRLGWTRRERSFAELGEFNQFLAVVETAAHLTVLADRQRVTVTDVAGVDHYAPRG
ncbi:MBL fold metallo-hydrolase [Haloechinothrix sp. LS1_15]|uniref:MBL fold metallo-hydrolase n=1 Tax=Haloechinothrix sp. LS1_15 TaxID=2652248 RepID=UPI002944331B|nr:MBL fold metallo-hydrolase [Haloechinothrix sp. LS1_15]MDV6012900.1 MBL fold metallo-hydrolase [Haloechinothrix sp. LS1_15]